MGGMEGVGELDFACMYSGVVMQAFEGMEKFEYLKFFGGAQDEIYAIDTCDFIGFELSVTTHDDDAGLGIETVKLTNGFAAFAIRVIGDRARIEHIDVSFVFAGDYSIPVVFKKSSD